MHFSKGYNTQAVSLKFEGVLHDTKDNNNRNNNNNYND